MGEYVTCPLSMIVQRAKLKVKVFVLSVVKQPCVFGSLSPECVVTALKILMVYSMCRPELCVGLRRHKVEDDCKVAD